LLFYVLMNGYPVMLQRYDQVLLCARFPTMQADERVPFPPGPRHPQRRERRLTRH